MIDNKDVFIFNKSNIFNFFLSMIKRPTVINMTLNAIKDAVEMQPSSTRQKSDEKYRKNSQVKDQGITQDIINFIKMMAQERNPLKKKEKKQNQPKEAAKTANKNEKYQTIPIPLGMAQSLEVVLRRYMLCRMEEKQEQLHPYSSKSKFTTHDKTTNIRALLYRTSKENTEGSHQEEEEGLDIFRSIACQRIDRQRLANRNRQLENEVLGLRERLREKNDAISKLLTKQTHLRRKYNDELNRLIRNKNIYDISVNFERVQEQGQGRNMLNITGKHIIDCQKEEQQFKRSSLVKNGYKSVKTLAKSDSEYFKDSNKSRIIKAKGKLNPFRCSKKNLNDSSPSTTFLKSINKSLPTECVGKTPCYELTRRNKQYPATFEMYVSQLQSNSLSKKQSVHLNEQQRMEMIGRLKEEEFQALQMVGFYDVPGKVGEHETKCNYEG